MACDYLTIPSSLVSAKEANLATKMTFDNRIKLHSCTFKVVADEVIDYILHDSQRKIKVWILFNWLFFI